MPGPSLLVSIWSLSPPLLAGAREHPVQPTRDADPRVLSRTQTHHRQPIPGKAHLLSGIVVFSLFGPMPMLCYQRLPFVIVASFSHNAMLLSFLEIALQVQE